MPLDAGQNPIQDADVRVARALATAMTGHTQTAISAATGIDQGRLSRITRPDSGRRENATLIEIAKIEAACGHAPGYVLTLAGLVTVAGAQAGEKALKASARTGIDQ